MRTFVCLSRSFRRRLGNRIVLQLISIGFLFMMICVHLQYEFSNRLMPSSRSHRRSSSSSNRRNYEIHFPTDEDDGTDWNDRLSRHAREKLERTRADYEDNDDDEEELFYIDINNEQNNAKDLSRGGGPEQRAEDVERGNTRNELLERGNKRGERRVQYQFRRKALLSKKVSSVGEEYQIPAESGERTGTGLFLQTWASHDHSTDAERQRFFKYITTTQVQCRERQAVGRSNPGGTGLDWPWTVCFDQGSSHVARGALRPGCVVYSFGARATSIRFETEMAERGCEVHIFDPSSRMRAHVLSETIQHSAGKVELPENIIFHKTTLDWRDSNVENKGLSSWKPKKLSAIMSELGHESIDIVRADLQSAEWKVLENILLDGTVSRIHQLLFNIHLNWRGFEVQGSSNDVIRFWYSVLKELQGARFQLFHSFEDKSEPSIFLGQIMANVSSTYTLGWVNSAWR